jgi:predicted metal-binding membrane protein
MPSPIEALLTQDRRVVTVALTAVTLSAWAYTLAGQRTAMGPPGSNGR